MSILVNKKTRLLVQGITGQEGLFHTKNMVDYGTRVVAGVTPGKGGEWVMNGKIPVFDSVKIAKNATGANTSVIFVPARFAADAIFEAADAQELPGSEGCPPGWSQLSRAAYPLRSQSRHHSREYSNPREYWCCLPVRHINL